MINGKTFYFKSFNIIIRLIYFVIALIFLLHALSQEAKSQENKNNEWGYLNLFFYSLSAQYTPDQENSVSITPVILNSTKLTYNDKWSLNAGILFSNNIFLGNELINGYSSFDDTRPDISFGEYSLILTNLYLEYRDQSFATYAGKILPTFGLKNRTVNSLGTDFILYDLSEKVGIGGEYTFNGVGGGKQTIYTNIFDDITKYTDTEISDAVPENLLDLSFAIALSGAISQEPDSLNYHFGFSRDVKNDIVSNGFVFGLQQTNYNLTDTLTMDWLAELAYIENFLQTPDDAKIFTISNSYKWDKWKLSAAYSLQDFNQDGTLTDFGDIDNLASIELSYSFDDIGTFALGYQYKTENGNDSEKISFSYSNFSIFQK